MRDPVFKLNTKPIERSLPVTNWHVPFLADISQCQVEQFSKLFLNSFGWPK